MRQVKKAIVLAAGRGRRMRPATLAKPKPLLKVAGKTFLEHIFDALPSSVVEVIVVVGYKGKQIKEYLGDYFKGRKICYVHQKKLNGTAYAFLLAKPLFRNQKERFFIIYGDELPTRQEFKKCLFRKFSWLCHEIYDFIPTGIAYVSKSDRILKVVERPKNLKTPIAVGGVILADAELFQYKPIKHENGEYYLTSMMDKFIKKHRVYAVMGKPNLYFTSLRDIDKFNKRYYALR